jgi:hypothetical protein
MDRVDGLKNHVWFLEDGRVLETENIKAEMEHGLIAMGIMLCPMRVGGSVEFDDQSKFMAIEVGDEKGFFPIEVVKQRMLAIEFVSAVVSVSQNRPQLFLRWGLLLPQIAATDFCSITQFSEQKQTHNISLIE